MPSVSGVGNARARDSPALKGLIKAASAIPVSPSSMPDRELPRNPLISIKGAISDPGHTYPLMESLRLPPDPDGRSKKYT